MLARLVDQQEYDNGNTQSTLKQTTKFRHIHFIFETTDMNMETQTKPWNYLKHAIRE